MSGRDVRDATTLAEPPSTHVPAAMPSIAGLRVGIPREYVVAELHPTVRAAWDAAACALADAGATIVPVSLPRTRAALPCYYVLAAAEAASNLSRYDAVRYGARPAAASDCPSVAAMVSTARARAFGSEVRRRIAAGTLVLSRGAYDAYCAHAHRVRALVAADFAAVFARHADILLVPTAASPPPTLAAAQGMDPVAAFATDVMTVPASLAGLPAISLPVPGQPERVGVQLIGARGADALVLDTAQALAVALLRR